MPYDDLDPILYGRDGTGYDGRGGKYEPTGYETITEIQESPECKNVHRLIGSLVENPQGVTYDKLVERVHEAQQTYHILDITHYREKEWNEADVRERKIYLKMIEYYYEKRSVGVCFLCGEKLFDNVLRQLCGFDLHHVDPSGKEHNPSRSKYLDLDQGRTERRKCVPLCKKCHIRVHNVDDDEKAFNDKFNKSYELDDDTTVVVCSSS